MELKKLIQNAFSKGSDIIIGVGSLDNSIYLVANEYKGELLERAFNLEGYLLDLSLPHNIRFINLNSIVSIEVITHETDNKLKEDSNGHR